MKSLIRDLQVLATAASLSRFSGTRDWGERLSAIADQADAFITELGWELFGCDTGDHVMYEGERWVVTGFRVTCTSVYHGTREFCMGLEPFARDLGHYDEEGEWHKSAAVGILIPSDREFVKVEKIV